MHRGIRFLLASLAVAAGLLALTTADDAEAQRLLPRGPRLDAGKAPSSSTATADAGKDASTTTCTPTTCLAQKKNCGTISDGCGKTLTCGTCASNETCGGGGVTNVCGASSTSATLPGPINCRLATCGSLGANCGTPSDGCGGTLSCGTCIAPATCGGGGQPNVCGTPTPSWCAAQTCLQASANCGPVANGCGKQLNCGTCTPPQLCGGGGVPSQCGGSCTAQTCTQRGATCGLQPDGCGGKLQCGSCPAGQLCMGSPSMCVATISCTPKTCAQLGQSCGLQGDGCGGIVDCGRCATECKPKTCADVASARGTTSCRSGATSGCLCGPIADGCGGLLDCGPCAAGQSCGVAGPSRCGTP